MNQPPRQPTFTHKVRCDQASWQRSRQVYWLVVGALWEHADSFMLQDYGRELILPELLTLPGVGTVSHQANTVAGPASAGARALLVRPDRDVWFSLTLYRDGLPIFYDEDGGDTMLFCVQPDTLSRLAASGVTGGDLTHLASSDEAR